MARGRHPDDPGDWVVVVVTQEGFRKSPFKSYVKTFWSVDDHPSATAQLYDWWFALPEDSYTRKRANVQIHWCVATENTGNKAMVENLYTPSTVKELLSR